MHHLCKCDFYCLHNCNPLLLSFGRYVNIICGIIKGIRGLKMEVRKRINYIDIAKGLAILLVISGHTFSNCDPGNIINRFIYSFHMPLFFILSGWCSSSSIESIDIKAYTLKKAKQLLIPYVVINTVKYIIKICLVGFSTLNFKHFIQALVYCNGYSRASKLLFSAPEIGMTWFLVALFFCQVLYVSLYQFAAKNNLSLGMLVVIIGLSAYGLNSIIWLPFALQPAGGALVFYFVGHEMKKRRIFEHTRSEISWPVVIIAAVIWIVAILTKTVAMHANSYPGMYAFVAAISGTYFAVQFAKGVEHVPVLGRFLLWCGKNSLFIYAFHALDVQYLAYLKGIVSAYISFPSTKGALMVIPLRIIGVVTVTAIFVFIKNRAKPLLHIAGSKKSGRS